MNVATNNTREVYVHHRITVGEVTLDLYPPPHGKGWWTPASPIFRLAGIPEAEELAFRQQHGMTKSHGGFEIVWDNLRPEHHKPVALLSRHAANAVLAQGRARGLSILSVEAESEIHAALAMGEVA